ncbi:MAG: DUF3750 domain-containing protein [Betaproteobacteria bacterium]
MNQPVRKKIVHYALWALAALLVSGPMLAVALGDAPLGRDWRNASQESVGLAPDAAATAEPVVQVYAARTVGWRGAFAVHTWIAVKPAGATGYTRYEVIGWRLRGGSSALSVSDNRAPDGEWFGARPQLLRDLRGADAAAVIARLPAALAAYPYGGEYRAWPGPNSNTFVAYMGREIPELRLTMPSNAIGKDYLPIDRIVGWSPSHTGIQLSLYGLAGAIVGWDEGIELNVLGLVTGVDVRRPALKLPGMGRVGMAS